MRFLAFFIVMLLAFPFTAAGQSFEVPVKDEKNAPVVVMTFPESGATDVNPAITEIRVTFNKEMMDKSWSWVQISPEDFPQITGGPRYLEDRKTCVLNVKLEPGKTYIIWLNTQKFRNFMDTVGTPAVPYLLTFETRK
jgi:RNA polymerase sigma-70 factor (ECF subfamily)